VSNTTIKTTTAINKTAMTTSRMGTVDSIPLFFCAGTDAEVGAAGIRGDATAAGG
jgi:hypothetical protein